MEPGREKYSYTQGRAGILQEREEFSFVESAAKMRKTLDQRECVSTDVDISRLGSVEFGIEPEETRGILNSKTKVERQSESSPVATRETFPGKQGLLFPKYHSFLMAWHNA